MKKLLMAGIAALSLFTIAAIGTRAPNVVRTEKVKDIEGKFDGPGYGVLNIFSRKTVGFSVTVWKENSGVSDSLRVFLQIAPTDRDSLAWKTIATFPSASTFYMPSDSTAANAVSYTYTGYSASDTLRPFGRYLRFTSNHRGAQAEADPATDTCRIFIYTTEFGDDLEK